MTRSRQKQADVTTIGRSRYIDGLACDAERIEWAELAASDPLGFEGFLRLRATESAASRADGTPGALDSGSDHTADREITGGDPRDPTAGDRHGVGAHAPSGGAIALTRDLIAMVGREPIAGQGVKLARLSITARRGFGPVRIIAHRFARECAERGSAHGVLLATDRRRDGSEHLYGLYVTDDARRGAERWCELSGADIRRGCRWKMVTGWDLYVDEGDDRLLRENLPRIFDYAAHPWADGRARRSGDVYASGALEPLRDAFTRLAAPEGGSTPADASEGQLRSREALHVCAACGRILRGMRSDAVWCSGRCRVAACRARRGRA